MHDDLYWLVMPQQMQYKLAVQSNVDFGTELQGTSPDLSVSEVPCHQYLQSARCHQLSVPRDRCSTFGTSAFLVARQTVWNSLPDHLLGPLTPNNLGGAKDVSVYRTFEVFVHLRCHIITLYKSTFTYLLCIHVY